MAAQQLKFENVHILSAKMVSGKISMEYINHLDKMDYLVTDEEDAHPHLLKAMSELTKDLAESFRSEEDYFALSGFSVTEKNGVFYLTLKGKFKTSHDEIIGINSGKIELSENPSDDLVVKLNTLRLELFNYFFNKKRAQMRIEFKDSEK